MRIPTVVLAIVAGAFAISLLLFRRERENEGRAPPANVTTSKPAQMGAALLTNSRATEIVRPTLNAPEAASWSDRWREFQLDASGLFGLQQESNQPEKLQRFVEGLSLAEVPEVLEMLRSAEEQNPSETGKDLEMRLLQRWAENDPKSAAAWALETPGATRKEAISRAAGAWAERNLSDAAAWATRLSETADRTSAVMQVATNAVYRDPVQALNLAGTLPAEAERDELIARACAAWAARAPEAAVMWANAIPDGGVREQALSSVVIALADSSPESAAELLTTPSYFGKFKKQVVVAIVQRLAIADPRAATEAVEKLPTSELRDAAKNVLNDVAQRLR